MRRTRVLIIDDSPTIRHLLTEILSRDPEIDVVGAAPDAAVARQMIKDLNPDVVTLDIEMPNMNGLEFLEKIMRLRPMPVVMISTLTQRGADVTLSALELGAVDYFGKPTNNVATVLNEAALELAEKVKTAANARVRATKHATVPRLPLSDFVPGDKIVAIGSSTGGVEALCQVLSNFPANCPPTVITQHMPSQFTTTFAQRLDKLCRPTVTEAVHGAPLKVGHVYLAPGTETHLTIAGRSHYTCHLERTDSVNGHRPSVDVLFHSVAKHVKTAVGVILTGMGRDGAAGLKAMRDRGDQTIGQDEASSVVYGMPRVAAEIGAVCRQLPLEKIGPEIIRLCAA